MKIAILGSAPSSRHLAPFNDPSWEIWGCSPGLAHLAMKNRLRMTRWFEIHHFIPPENEFTPEYIGWMASLAPAPVYMIEAVPPIPNSVPYPKNEMLRRYGPYFFTSSPAWMTALALSVRGVCEIGFWGIDMQATEEYGQQRQSLHHFADLAKRRGIKITSPPQSDLFWPTPLYGFWESEKEGVKILTRRRELEDKHKQACDTRAAADREMWFFQGALSDMQYHINNYSPREQL